VYLDRGKVFLILILSKFGIMFIFNIAEVYFRTYFDVIKSLLCCTVKYMTTLLRLYVIPIKKDIGLLYLKLPPVFNISLINIFPAVSLKFFFDIILSASLWR